MAKTIETFPPKTKFNPFNYNYSKKCSDPIFVSEIGPVLYLQDLKKFGGH